MSPSLPRLVASTPVSSATSRSAVSSGFSPVPTRPFGSAQRPSGLPPGRIAATTKRPRSRRTSTPPAENSRNTSGFVTNARRSPCKRPATVCTMPWHSKGWSAKRCHKVPRSRRRCMNLQPLGDRLIVEVLEEEETTVSGIVLPDTAKEKPQRGRVLAVGPGPRDDKGKVVPMDVAEDDEIIFSKYGGTEVKLGTDEVLILRESDVLAKVVGTREPVPA